MFCSNQSRSFLYCDVNDMFAGDVCKDVLLWMAYLAVRRDSCTRLVRLSASRCSGLIIVWSSFRFTSLMVCFTVAVGGSV